MLGEAMRRLAWRNVIGAMQDLDLDDPAELTDGATIVAEVLSGALSGKLVLGVIDGTELVPAEPTMRRLPLSSADPRLRVLGAVVGFTRRDA
ncbi:MAG: hypothetical protein AMXMBFR64_57540 [Myxococcales bacterium]